MFADQIDPARRRRDPPRPPAKPLGKSLRRPRGESIERVVFGRSHISLDGKSSEFVVGL
jgi:hypothetical protein